MTYAHRNRTGLDNDFSVRVGDRIHSRLHGLGTVVRIIDRPTLTNLVRVRFDRGYTGTINLTQARARAQVQLNLG